MNERWRPVVEALRLIESCSASGRWCESFTSGSCSDDPSRTVTAPYGADRWCTACVAHAAVNGIALRLFQPAPCPPVADCGDGGR